MYVWMEKLLAHLGKFEADEEPLPLLTVLESNELDDTLWCLRTLGPEHDRWMREYAVWCARQVQHLMTDPCSFAALDVAERYARGEATGDELSTAEAWLAAEAARSAAAAEAWAAARSATAAAWSAQTARLRELLS